MTYSLDMVRGMTIHFEKLMEKVSPSDCQIKEAKNIAQQRGVPKGDAIHAILSRDSRAILVSRDRHFEKLKDICEVAKPEDIN